LKAKDWSNAELIIDTKLPDNDASESADGPPINLRRIENGETRAASQLSLVAKLLMAMGGEDSKEREALLRGFVARVKLVSTEGSEAIKQVREALDATTSSMPVLTEAL
jgi:hypothetical protein